MTAEYILLADAASPWLSEAMGEALPGLRTLAANHPKVHSALLAGEGGFGITVIPTLLQFSMENGTETVLRYDTEDQFRAILGPVGSSIDALGPGQSQRQTPAPPDLKSLAKDMQKERELTLQRKTPPGFPPHPLPGVA